MTPFQANIKDAIARARIFRPEAERLGRLHSMQRRGEYVNHEELWRLEQWVEKQRALWFRVISVADGRLNAKLQGVALAAGIIPRDASARRALWDCHAGRAAGQVALPAPDPEGHVARLAALAVAQIERRALALGLLDN